MAGSEHHRGKYDALEDAPYRDYGTYTARWLPMGDAIAARTVPTASESHRSALLADLHARYGKSGGEYPVLING